MGEPSSPTAEVMVFGEQPGGNTPVDASQTPFNVHHAAPADVAFDGFNRRRNVDVLLVAQGCQSRLSKEIRDSNVQRTMSVAFFCDPTHDGDVAKVADDAIPVDITAEALIERITHLFHLTQLKRRLRDLFALTRIEASDPDVPGMGDRTTRIREELEHEVDFLTERVADRDLHLCWGVLTGYAHGEESAGDSALERGSGSDQLQPTAEGFVDD